MTALLEYLIWITRPRTNNHGAKKPPCKSSEHKLPILSSIKTDSISHKQRTPKNLTMSAILYGFSSVMAFWQEETARFGLFPSKNEIKNRSWSRTMFHSASLATFYPRILLTNGQISVLSEIHLARVRNPKNQLLQIDPPTIVGCSLWYPIARSTMKPEARLLFSQKYRF